MIQKLSGTKLNKHCQILLKSWVEEPVEDVGQGGDDPLHQHPDHHQESEQAGQWDDCQGHVVDDGPQVDELDQKAGSHCRIQPPLYLPKSHCKAILFITRRVMLQHCPSKDSLEWFACDQICTDICLERTPSTASAKPCYTGFCFPADLHLKVG